MVGGPAWGVNWVMSGGFIRGHAGLRGGVRIPAVLAPEVQLELKRCTITITVRKLTAPTTPTVMGTVTVWADIRMCRCRPKE